MSALASKADFKSNLVINELKPTQKYTRVNWAKSPKSPNDATLVMYAKTNSPPIRPPKQNLLLNKR